MDGILCLIKDLRTVTVKEYMHSRIPCYVLVENSNSIHDQEIHGNSREFHLASHPKHIVNCLTSLESQARVRGEFYQGHTTTELFLEVQMVMDDEIRAVLLQVSHHLCVDVERHWLEPAVP